MTKRLTALFMAVIMIITMLPLYASAQDTDVASEFKCAWFNETLTYPFEYSDSFFDVSPTEYSHDLATFSLAVSMASFNSFDKEKGDEHIRAMLEKCGYEVVSYGYETEDYDTVGVAFGRKRIAGKIVIIAAVRSGNYGMEWGGNLRVGSGTGDHEGFTIAKNTLINYTNQYFKEYPCEGKAKLLIPGYSRGGSIANLTAAALDDKSYVDALGKARDYIATVDFELYAYTFEAPQSTTSKEYRSELYANIFNVVNPNDYVPMFVMDEWGFKNYGNRVELPGADNCDDYDSYYERVCAEFDSYMGQNGRKAKNCFYNKEDSRSAETTLNYIFATIGSDVMRSRDVYHESCENSLIFFLGNYLGKKRKVKDVARTVGLISAGTALAAKPKNLKKLQSEGYRKYISEYIAKNNGGELSQEDIEATINLLVALLKYLNVNRKDVASLAEQLNSVLQVHQPYVGYSWMLALNDNDIEEINGEADSLLKLSCKTMTLKYDVNGKIVSRYDETIGSVKWRSDDERIVSVDENGVVHTNDAGKTRITATLVSENGDELEECSVIITVKMSPMQTVVKTVRELLKV